MSPEVSCGPSIEIREESAAALLEYGEIPIAFEVSEVLALSSAEPGLEGIHLVPRRVASPYVKDYDADPDNRPSRWSARFELRHWGILSAWREGERVGGAVVGWRSPDLEPRSDVAVLWDVRVVPRARRQGIATALFASVEAWAVARGARWLKIETQNVNLPACRFYVTRGCTLGAVHRFAYAAFPEEVQLLWYKRLPRLSTEA